MSVFVSVSSRNAGRNILRGKTVAYSKRLPNGLYAGKYEKIFRVEAQKESANLDLLRSLAVLLVVGFHLDLYFLEKHTISRDQFAEFNFHETGHWGVLLFFVHTSLVLMFSLERQRRYQTGSSLFWPFLTRRIFRIYPASIFIVVLVWSFRLPVGNLKASHFGYAHVGWGGFVSNLFLLQNITRSDSILVTLWSLPYEMQMYLFLPALYLLVSRSRTPLTALVLWAGADFFCTHTRHLREFGFGLLADITTYFPCFLAGVVAYRMSKARTLRLPPALWPLALAAITLTFLHWQNQIYLCCFLVGIVLPQFREISNRPVVTFSRVIARYSYGIYLTHFICLWLAFEFLHALPMWCECAVFVSSGALAPYLLYHGLEEPMIRLGKAVVANLFRQPTPALTAPETAPP